MEALCVKNLSFSHGADKILQSVNLSVSQGEFAGILGPNGSGKTTLLKHALGILTPLEGSVKILGKSVSEYGERELARILGFLPQKTALSMPLSVDDVLYTGLYASLKSPLKGYGKEDAQKLAEVAQTLRVAHLRKRSIATLSGGELQRVLLARAIVSSPKMLLLDEPTSAMDMNYAIEIMKLCEELLKKFKITVVATLHDLNLASLFCDKVFFLKEGKILHEGSPKALFTPKILKEIYGFACEVIHRHDQAVIIPLKDNR